MATKPLQDLRGSLLLIGLAAQQRPELVAERLDLLLKVGRHPLPSHICLLKPASEHLRGLCMDVLPTSLNC